MVDVVSSLTSSLGIGSGINTTQLVSDLTEATYGPRQSQLNALMSANSARISALASAKSSLKTFSDALSKLLQGTQYSGQPVSNDPTIASVKAIPGGNPTGLPAQIEVIQLAAAQVLEADPLSAASDVAGTGTLVLSVDGEDYDIELGATDNKLSDLAKAINESGSGVTASIVTDQSGARLVLKGETGVDKAFTLADGGDADANLLRFVWNGNTADMTRRQTAADAQIKIDNVAMAFDKNEITTAIPNLRIDLNRAAPGTQVTLATDQPTASMSELVGEIVDAFNTLKSSLNTAMRSGDGQSTSSGLLANDSGARAMSNRLARLTSTDLTTDGDYTTLADIGVTTNRDGTLTLDKTLLDKALAADPKGVVQMLNPTTPDETHIGIAGALKSITDFLNADQGEINRGPLTSSNKYYAKLQESYSKQLTDLNLARGEYADGLTKTYSAMQARLLQFKATQSYLEQQIAVWKNNR